MNTVPSTVPSTVQEELQGYITLLTDLKEHLDSYRRWHVDTTHKQLYNQGSVLEAAIDGILATIAATDPKLIHLNTLVSLTDRIQHVADATKFFLRGSSPPI